MAFSTSTCKIVQEVYGQIEEVIELVPITNNLMSLWARCNQLKFVVKRLQTLISPFPDKLKVWHEHVPVQQ